MSKLFASILFAASAVVCMAEELRHEVSRPLMGTRFSIVCYAADEAQVKKATDEAFTIAEEVNAVASDYIPDSELMRLSKAPIGEPVELSPMLFELLADAREIAEKTDGAYDPTLGPITRLWRKTRKTGKLPDDETLQAALNATGWQQYTLDPEARTITLKKPDMQFDLGGIAKGYAADQMMSVMRKYGITRTSIVAGGDIVVGDAPPGKDGWNIGLKTFNKDKPTEVIELTNSAVSTSGDLHQFVEVDGKRYSHIIDPKTGLGLTDPIAASVIAPNATLTDALATAACVTGPEQTEESVKACGATDLRVRIGKTHR